MEIICRIKEEQPLTEREYTNRNGMPEKFASKGFILQSGPETIFCEMVQDQARSCGTLDKNYYYKAALQITARDWEDNNHQKRWENRIVLKSLAVL